MQRRPAVADRYITPSDIRLLAERLDKVILEYDEEQGVIDEAVLTLKDFALLVEAGLKRDRRAKRA